MMFGKAPREQRVSRDNCKIKIKNTAEGKTISFEGNCSKEQLEMAKHMNLDDYESDEEDS